MKKKYQSFGKKHYFLLIILLVLSGCSSEKNTFVSRNYHTFVSYFNGFYNARKKFKEGVKKVESQVNPLNASEWNPLYIPKQADKSAIQTFDQVIKKCDVIIFRHKNGKYVDDCRLLNGKCWYYKGNLPNAKQNFEYVLIAFPETPLKKETTYWLARTQFAEGRYYAAEQTLEKILPFDNIKERNLRKEVKLLYSMILIRHEDYAGAITFLDKTLKDVKKKKEKAEIYFLIAQLYEKLNNFSKAREYYRKVAQLNTSSELAFASLLREIQMTSRNPSARDKELKQVYSKLKRLLQEKQYADFKAEIYYEMGYIAQRKKRYDKAIEFYKNSLANNTQNITYKLNAYWDLGELYFSMNDFTNAQLYYDSAASVVPNEHENYKVIKAKAENLKEFVKHKKRIHLNDSLIKISRMPEDKLKKYVENVVREEEEREQQKLLKEQQAQQTFLDPNLLNPQQVSTGKFYFDDPQQIASGKARFTQTWGNRPDEDHWRRKNKRKIFTEQEKTEENPELKGLSPREKKVKEYLANVPKNDKERSKLLQEIEESLLKTARIFLEDFKMPDSALATYLVFLKRFPQSVETPAVLYAVYTIARDLQKNSLAEQMKKRLLDEFPQSVYAQRLLNPTKKLKDEKAESFEAAYSGLVELYDKGEYQSALGFSEFMLKKFAQANEIDKVYFICGACCGKLGQKDSLKKIYNELIAKYPKKETAKIAKKILAELNKKPAKQKTNNANPKTRKKQEPEEKENFAGFNIEKKQNERIVVVLLINKDKIKVHELKSMISDFNRNYFSNERLSLNAFFYKNKHLVYITQFPDFKSADAYLQVLLETPQIVSLLDNPETDAVFISPSNFRVAFSQKRFEDYGKFFRKYRQKMLEE